MSREERVDDVSSVDGACGETSSLINQFDLSNSSKLFNSARFLHFFVGDFKFQPGLNDLESSWGE